MKTLRVLIIVILVIIILPLIGYVAWNIKKGVQLEVYVVNKSMTRYHVSENRAMNYILNSKKIFTEGNRPYDLRVDHIGLFWNNGDYRTNYPQLKDVTRTVEKADMFYYADVFGITSSYLKKKQAKEAGHLEYGGLNNTDYSLLKELISNKKQLVIESSFFEFSTDPLVRYKIEKLLDVYYLGWIGKYVKNLAAEVNTKEMLDWKKLYKEYTGEASTAVGPGIVMINIDARRIVVLEEGKQIETKGGLAVVSLKKAVEKYGLPDKTYYNGWFTMLHPGNNSVLSQFILNTTESGKAILNENGIPEKFPALIQVKENCYYMAGDFGKCKVNGLFPKVLLFRSLYDGIKRGSSKPENFFYSYYRPFMSTMLDDAIDSSEKME